MQMCSVGASAEVYSDGGNAVAAKSRDKTPDICEQIPVHALAGFSMSKCFSMRNVPVQEFLHLATYPAALGS